MIRVWHNENTFSERRNTPAQWPADFVLVAEVTAEELGEAYYLTNHVSTDWRTNPGVTVKSPRAPRSTSVGDVMELADGSLQIVKGIGFGPVNAERNVSWQDTY